MDNLFQRLTVTPELIDHGLLVRITDRNGDQNFLFPGDGYIPPDDIRIVYPGMLNARAQTFPDRQKADVLGKTAAVENRIISQAGIEAKKDYLGGVEKFIHRQGEGIPFLLILAFNA
jgi:hypothetical protein